MNSQPDLYSDKKDHTYSTPNRRLLPGTAGALLLAAFILVRLDGHAQKTCKDCCIPSFGALTVYHVVQSGSALGFGLEAGKWNKEESRFSYFMGGKMQWFNPSGTTAKSGNSSEDLRFSFYMKGQFEILRRFYLVASPQLINLSSFEASVGIRYAYPLADWLGIGVEPTYSIIGRQYSLNTNLHIALR